MRISTRTVYGIKLLYELANSYGEKPIKISEIASKQYLSEKYLSKIMIQLKSAGIVKSERGANGGYSLTNSPSQINMLKVIEILEGEMSFKDFKNGKNFQEINNFYPGYNFLEGLIRAIHNYLNSKTLQDLVNEYNKQNEKIHIAYYI